MKKQSLRTLAAQTVKGEVSIDDFLETAQRRGYYRQEAERLLIRVTREMEETERDESVLVKPQPETVYIGSFAV